MTMPDFRHHRAGPDGPIIVLVPVPFESGSPAPAKQAKPSYPPRRPNEAWKPQRAIPSNAKRLQRLLDDMHKRDADVRAFMSQARLASMSARATTS
jgi:hypothetical protein